ncbi:uncharacterized protein LOC130281967 [Hyla sarda]|uniref:uncharacterized protein LOC130281967 n=1 Tax=Hyla sarda TaxID=327740 RepID=UPI0024C31ECF|nr:uncharacterized protein LOC130281967 [Hyla sarda]
MAGCSSAGAAHSVPILPSGSSSMDQDILPLFEEAADAVGGEQGPLLPPTQSQFLTPALPLPSAPSLGPNSIPPPPPPPPPLPAVALLPAPVVSQPPRDRVDSGSVRRSRGSYSRSSSRGSGRSRRSRTAVSHHGCGRRCRRESRSRARSRRSRSSRWRSPSSSGESSWSSFSPDRRSHRRSGRRRKPRPARRSSREVDQPSAVATPAPVERVDPVPVPQSDPSSTPPVVPARTVPGLQEIVPDGRAGGSIVPSFGLGPSDRRLMPLLESSMAASTWTGHGKAWNEWCLLVSGRNVAECPRLRLEVTVDYLLSLRSANFSALVARRRLAGVSFYFRLLGWEDITKRFLIQQSLKGWQRTQVRKDLRRPVSYPLLVSLLQASVSCCTSNFEATLYSAAFCVAFFGALRVGELVPSSKRGPGGLLFDDVVSSNGVLQLRIRRSKTDQVGQGAWIRLQSVDGPACPVRAVAEYLLVRVSSVQFFTHSDGLPLSRYQFQTIFKRCLQWAGAPPSEFGTHSFRIGAATEASRAGLSVSDIQRIGQWRSACYAGYVRPELLL